MNDLNDDNDPMLFSVTLPHGKLIVQYMEVLASLQSVLADGGEPTQAQLVQAIRATARTVEIAVATTDAMLIAAWHRMTGAIQASGKI
jgi:hypothetical protein